jgi:hypothetical protein
MWAIIAFILFVIAAILAWLHLNHADAIAYAGLAALALEGGIVWARARIK